MYINKWLSKLRLSLQSDVINHCNINIVVFHNHHDINFTNNIYSDSNQTTLQVLCNNIRDWGGKTIIMTSDFNIRDSNWDPNFYHHSIHTKDLMTIADSLDLELFHLSNPSPTRYADNSYDTNSVLDLVFLVPKNPRFGKHTLLPKIYKFSNHIVILLENLLWKYSMGYTLNPWISLLEPTLETSYKL